MKKPPIPRNETERLDELERLNLLENLSDDDLDLITKLASDICVTKVSLVTLIDSNTQIFKSKYGIDLEKTSRNVAFCAHAINEPDKMLIVNDATQDERFKENPLVTKEPNIAFYAGMPLSTKAGTALGTLCVIDSKPKVLSPSQIESLKSLAKLVERLFESHRTSLNLEKANYQLEQHRFQTEEIAYTIAHDLKNPLDSIHGFLELLQKESGTSLGEEALEYIEYAKQSTRKMTSLIYEILAFAKISSTSNEKEPVDLESLLQSIIELNLPIIRSENIKIEYENLPVVYTSKASFSTVLRNLIGNAIKYKSPERALNIKIIVEDKLEEWLFKVEDNGKGIKDTNTDKIFRPFYKEDKTNNDGVGMGLATCKKIILNLGGKISVDSEFGVGSAFKFTLPK